MSLSFRRASLASLGLAFGLSALCLSPSMAQETKPAQPDATAPAAAPAAPVDPNAVVATIVAVAQLSQSGPLVHLAFFLISGLLWVLPAMAIIKWLIIEPRPKS